MAVAKVQMIMSQGLTTEEEEKYDRLEPDIAGILMVAGYAPRICEPDYSKGYRRLLIRDANIAKPLVSITAERFLALPDEQFLRELAYGLGQN